MPLLINQAPFRGTAITYPFTFEGDVIFDGDATFNANTNVGPITADSLFVDGNIDLPIEVALRGRNSSDTAWINLIRSSGASIAVVGPDVGAVNVRPGRLAFTSSGSLNTANREIVGIAGGDSFIYNVRTGGVHNFAVSGVTGFNTKAGGVQYSVAAVPAVNIDWNTATIHTKTISADTTFTMSNVSVGQPVIVEVINSGTHTVSWTNPSGLTIEWVGKVVPVQTHNGKDRYIFDRIGTVIIGRVMQDIG